MYGKYRDSITDVEVVFEILKVQQHDYTICGRTNTVRWAYMSEVQPVRGSPGAEPTCSIIW